MKTLQDILEKLANKKLELDTDEWYDNYNKLIEILYACKNLTEKDDIDKIIAVLDEIEDECQNTSPYKSVFQLSKDQLTELKGYYYTQKHKNASWQELANINSYVSDSEIIKEYENTQFVDDDFFCSSGFVVD